MLELVRSPIFQHILCRIVAQISGSGHGPCEHKDHGAVLRPRQARGRGGGGHEDVQQPRGSSEGDRRCADADRIQDQPLCAIGDTMNPEDFVDPQRNHLTNTMDDGNQNAGIRRRMNLCDVDVPPRHKGSQKSIMAPRGRFELPRAMVPTSFPGSRLTGLDYLGSLSGNLSRYKNSSVSFHVGDRILWGAGPTLLWGAPVVSSISFNYSQNCYIF